MTHIFIDTSTGECHICGVLENETLHEPVDAYIDYIGDEN